MAIKIYTRTGDKGQTSLVDGTRVSKASLRVKAYGSVDELNSMLGVVLSELATSNYELATLEKELVAIQHDLFSLGAYLADPKGKVLTSFDKRAKDFEKRIDSLTEKLAPLKTFILPGGGKAGALLHVARTLCRKAERHVVALSEGERVEQSALTYLNRLSDLLFTMARFTNYLEKQPETPWVKPTK